MDRQETCEIPHASTVRHAVLERRLIKVPGLTASSGFVRSASATQIQERAWSLEPKP